jgi:tetratricopeptide (TPR) repeat protein
MTKSISVARISPTGFLRPLTHFKTKTEMFDLFKKVKDPVKLAKRASGTTDPVKAVNYYSDAIKYEDEKESPDKKFLSNIYLLRGEIYLSQGVAVLSSSDFINSIDLNPENGIAHNDLGIWYTIEDFDTPDFKKAYEHLNKAVEFCPGRRDFKMNRAIIKVKMGDKETGRQELEQLLKDGYAEAGVAIEKFCD